MRVRDGQKLQKQIDDMKETLESLTIENQNLNKQLMSTGVKKSQDLRACNEKLLRAETKIQKYKDLEDESESDKNELESLNVDRGFPSQCLCDHLILSHFSLFLPPFLCVQTTRHSCRIWKSIHESKDGAQ